MAPSTPTVATGAIGAELGAFRLELRARIGFAISELEYLREARSHAAVVPAEPLRAIADVSAERETAERRPAVVGGRERVQRER
jgi:hypothetical protein